MTTSEGQATAGGPQIVIVVDDHLAAGARQIMSPHRLSVVTSELLTAALVHRSPMHVAEANVGRAWRDVFAGQGVAIHIHPSDM